MTTGTRLPLGIAVIVAVTGYMAYLGASSSWQYYLTADECAEQASSLVGSRVRVSGKVRPQSLEIAENRKRASFSLAGDKADVEVLCDCVLPDNLRDGIEVVVEGRLDETAVLRGEKVLTRCSSKYQSKASGGSQASSTHESGGDS